MARELTTDRTALNFEPVDCDARPRQKADLATQRDEAGTDASDGRSVLPAELGNGLVIGRQLACQPHDLDVAARFTLQTPARRDPVEIAVDVEF